MSTKKRTVSSLASYRKRLSLVWQSFGFKGFTLIELLIVIAVLGILATVILIALDPIEQTKRGQDAGRISTTSQLGHALDSYYTAQQSYPLEGNDWQTTLVNAGELKKEVSVTQPSSGGCSASLQNGYCYTTSNGNALIWTILESKNSFKKGGCADSQVPAAIFDSSQGKAGIGCLNGGGAIPGVGIDLH